MKKFISVAVAVTMLLCVFIVSGCSQKAKTFSKDGMQITLNASFKEYDVDDTTAYYSSSRVYLAVIKDTREDIAAQGGNPNMTLNQYVIQCKKNNDAEYAKTNSSGGITYFAFSRTDDKKVYTVFASVYETADAFWIFSFACELKHYDETKDDFIKWAKSVTFPE